MEDDNISALEAAAEAADKEIKAPKPRAAKGGNSVHKHPVLTDAEVEAAIKAAEDRLAAAEKKAATEKLIADSMLKIQRERNALTGQVDLDEMVQITIDVAEYTDRIILDGEQFFHLYTYNVPRHKAQTIQELMFRTYMHQAQLDGKDPQEAYRRSHSSHVTKGGVAPLSAELDAKLGRAA